jgi:PKD repeat protein
VASNVSNSTTSPTPVDIPLVASDPDGNALALRIVSQPANGTVGISGTTATYFPYAGFSGTDTFTYAAWDGSVDSNLATVTVTVAPGPSCTVTAAGSAPATATVNTAVAFSGSGTTATCAGTVGYDWNFGDGSAHATLQNPSHAYAAAGTFQWTLTATIGGVADTTRGSIAISTTTQTGAPTITSVRQLSEPFRIQIDVTNFQAGVQVFLGGSTTPWPTVTRNSSQQLILGGADLSQQFPRNQRVSIKVENPDRQSATTTYRRRQ